MKKHFVLLLGLSALAGLWSCQQEVHVPDNPTYDPEKNTVNTQFILNISAASGSPDTKQTAQAVQAGGINDFRGITNAHILPYKLEYARAADNNHFLFMPKDASSKATRDYDMGTLVKVDDINNSTQSRVVELALPLGTNAILVYGRAPMSSEKMEKEKYGSVIATGTALNNTLDNVSFKLENRLADADTAAFRLFGDLMGRVLTGIMNSGFVIQTSANGYKLPTGVTSRDNRYKFWWPTTSVNLKGVNDDASVFYVWDTMADGETIVVNDTTFTLHFGSVRWKEYGEKYKKNIDTDSSNDVELKALEEVLGEAYYQIMHLERKTVGDGDGAQVYEELRAASSASVLRLTSDLYLILQRVTNANPTSWEEQLAKLLANEILSRARNFFTISEAGEVSFQTVSKIMDGVDALIPDRNRAYYSLITDAFFYRKGVQPGYPINLGMPMGASLMQFREVGPEGAKYDAVIYLKAIPAYGMGGAALPINNYRYPAELMYYTNSSIRVSDKPHSLNDYPATTSAWNDDSSTSKWTNDLWKSNGTVETSTRSVAVTKPLNYGTALMKSVVKYNSTSIEDNNKGIHPAETPNTVDVTSGTKFRITGIMIGGVCDEVGWNFLPKDGCGFDKMIYDNLTMDAGTPSEGVAIPAYGSSTDAIYTLTWDNYDGKLALDKQSKVYVALELVNDSGQDLWGELNIIRNGGTFYLVAELDPTTVEAAAKLPKKSDGKVNLNRSDFFYPPFDSEGNTIDAVRVFMQDYVTSVTFNFSKNSLKHAYVTMPDLRSGQVSLGLSVDLEWEEGPVFDVNLGGE